MDNLLLFLSLEQAYLHAASTIGLSRGEFLLEARDHLASGKLQSSGRSRNTGGRRVDIPGDAWRDYKPFFDNGGYASRAMVNGINTRPDLPVFGWGDLRFPRENVLALWGANLRAEITDEEIKKFIRAEADKLGGYLPQKAGADIVRDKYSDCTKDRALRLVKAVIRNEKPGPRGPRNK
jgi:hypothetical protein